jgi:hypothetical protein
VPAALARPPSGVPAAICCVVGAGVERVDIAETVLSAGPLGKGASAAPAG